MRSVLIALLIACGAPRANSQHADLVLLGGDVWTLNGDAATAIAVRGDKIAAVGADGDVRAWIGPGTRVIELAGATVTPGLVDAHCHLYGLGVDLESVDVRRTASEREAAAIVAASTKGSDDWIIGRGWDQNRWPGQQFPTHASLDAIAQPVVLSRIDGHAIWVNARAMAAAGVTADTKDPPGGKIVRDAAGKPTGVFVDNATLLIESKIPAASDEVRERRIRAAAKVAISAGITGVHEMGIEDATARVYERLGDAGELPLRVYAFHLGSAEYAPPPAHGRFRMGGIKFFADGALGSRGARLYADYDDDPGNRGLWVTAPQELKNDVVRAVGNGWQVAIHAIGDAGVGSVLDAYETAGRSTSRDLRLRIEHLQVVAPKDWDRVVATHAIASMQPTHATSDMPWAEQRLGKERILGAYAWRTVLGRRIPLAFGSDFPVEDVGPLLGIYAAVMRQDAAGSPPGGWYPAQRMTLQEAIAAFTTGAAYAEFAEHRRGSIAVGLDADLTVFDRKLAADRSLLETRVQMTVVGGQIVYQSIRK